MMKFFKFIEYAYLAIAAFFIFEAVRNWNDPDSQRYFFLGFAAVGIFMYFFKRRFRKRMEQRNKK